MGSGKVYLLMTFFAASCVCSPVSECSDVSVLYDNIPVSIAVDCSSLRCGDLVFQLGFVDNNVMCTGWALNEMTNESPLLPIETPHSATVNLMAVCSDQRTSASLHCYILNLHNFNLYIQIYNGMHLHIHELAWSEALCLCYV